MLAINKQHQRGKCCNKAKNQSSTREQRDVQNQKYFGPGLAYIRKAVARAISKTGTAIKKTRKEKEIGIHIPQAKRK